jgi:transmembrane sensor
MNKQIIEEAAEWFVEFNTGEPEPLRKQAFDEWLRKSPEHVRCYLELLPLWEDAALRPTSDTTSVDELIALGRRPDTVIAWHGTQDATTRGHLKVRSALHGKRYRRRLNAVSRRFVLASSMVMVFVIGTILWSQSIRGQTFTTAVGEQRTVQLTDGSSIELNTDSRVRVRFGDHQRDVELTYGQALFHVAKDPTRPFVVASDRSRIRAVGTEFDVYLRNSSTTVTVLEGRVAVLSDERRDDSGARLATPVSAGEQITIDAPIVGAELSSPKRTDVTNATAWIQHRLRFESTPLPQVAAEFNRYNTRHLIVNDQRLRDFHVSGSFASTDPASLVRFLEAQRGLVVRETHDGIYISQQ